MGVAVQLPRALVRLVLLTIMFSAPQRGLGAEDMANAIFLVASSELKERTFRETVVLVTQPPRGGPWGVIINRPLVQRLSEVFSEYETLKDRKDVLHFGGPVQRDGLVFLVRTTDTPPRAVPVLKDVYFVSDLDWIDGLFRRPEPTRGVRVYYGHSGWAPGQLQKELERGGWHVVPADAETVFDKDPARIWPELIQRAGTKQTRKHEPVPFPALRGSFRIPGPLGRTLPVTHHPSPVTDHVSWINGAHP